MMIDALERLAALHARGALTDQEFARAKAQLLAMDAFHPTSRGLRRAGDDRWLGGVCGGIARATQTEAWIWRLLFVLITFFAGLSVLVYLLLWIFIPKETNWID
jgi:phage shock protein PspC (stress-responsive transcriptional regulator)